MVHGDKRTDVGSGSLPHRQRLRRRSSGGRQPRRPPVHHPLRLDVGQAFDKERALPLREVPPWRLDEQPHRPVAARTSPQRPRAGSSPPAAATLARPAAPADRRRVRVDRLLADGQRCGAKRNPLHRDRRSLAHGGRPGPWQRTMHTQGQPTASSDIDLRQAGPCHLAALPSPCTTGPAGGCAPRVGERAVLDLHEPDPHITAPPEHRPRA